MTCQLFRYTGPMTDQPWLSDQQLRAWRGWMALTTQLPAALHRQLQADSGLSLPDFEVLVHLTDTPDERLRVTDLARALNWDRSRVSHHIKRMAGRGLVTREECDNDGRAAYVVLSAAGRTAIERAAPGHARKVREVVFDHLTPEELAALESITTKVLERLEPDAAPACAVVAGPTAETA